MILSAVTAKVWGKLADIFCLTPLHRPLSTSCSLLHTISSLTVLGKLILQYIKKRRFTARTVADGERNAYRLLPLYLNNIFPNHVSGDDLLPVPCNHGTPSGPSHSQIILVISKMLSTCYRRPFMGKFKLRFWFLRVMLGLNSLRSSPRKTFNVVSHGGSC